MKLSNETKKMLYKESGLFFKALRLGAGLTRYRLAKNLETSENAIRNVEENCNMLAPQKALIYFAWHYSEDESGMYTIGEVKEMIAEFYSQIHSCAFHLEMKLTTKTRFREWSKDIRQQLLKSILRVGK